MPKTKTATMPKTKTLTVRNLSKRGQAALLESVHASFESEIPGVTGPADDCPSLNHITVSMWVRVDYTDDRYTAKDRALLTRLVGQPHLAVDGVVYSSPDAVWDSTACTLDGEPLDEFDGRVRRRIGTAEFVAVSLLEPDEFFFDMDSLSQDHCHMAEAMLTPEFDDSVEMGEQGLAMMYVVVEEEFRGIDLGLHAITLFLLTWARLSPDSFVTCYPAPLGFHEPYDEYDGAAIRFKLMQHWERAGFVEFKDGYMVADFAGLTVAQKSQELWLAADLNGY